MMDLDQACNLVAEFSKDLMLTRDFIQEKDPRLYDKLIKYLEDYDSEEFTHNPVSLVLIEKMSQQVKQLREARTVKPEYADEVAYNKLELQRDNFLENYAPGKPAHEKLLTATMELAFELKMILTFLLENKPDIRKQLLSYLWKERGEIDEFAEQPWGSHGSMQRLTDAIAELDDLRVKVRD